MPIILETKHFLIEGHDHPHHDRDNGGHAKINPRERFSDRTQMPMDLYLEMMQWVLVLGEAITTVMRQKGIPVVRINYQDNGNWPYFLNKEPQVHVHLYVRSSEEKHPAGDLRFKAFPNSLFTPYSGDDPEYYSNFIPYSEGDCIAIKTEILRLLETAKYVELSGRI